MAESPLRSVSGDTPSSYCETVMVGCIRDIFALVSSVSGSNMAGGADLLDFRLIFERLVGEQVMTHSLCIPMMNWFLFTVVLDFLCFFPLGVALSVFFTSGWCEVDDSGLLGISVRKESSV